MDKVKEKKITVVILNYMNYLETNECVKSVLKQSYNNFDVLIVDNNSNNNSYEYLKKRYYSNKKVSIIRTRKNYGFAKGNNIGIRYALEKLYSEYIVLLNSDVLINDSEYLYKMISLDSEEVGVIGNRIIEKNNSVIDYLYRYIKFPATLFFYLARLSEYTDHPLYQVFWERKLEKYTGNYILKGCALLLTPSYFKYYTDLDPRTFLYCEEELLYLRCEKVGLREKINDNVCIYHKGRQSTKILYRNEERIFLKYLLSSYKFVLWESIKMFLYNKEKRE